MRMIMQPLDRYHTNGLSKAHETAPMQFGRALTLAITGRRAQAANETKRGCSAVRFIGLLGVLRRKDAAMELTMSMFASQADYWKARAEKAEKEFKELHDMVYTNGDRSMTMKGRTFLVYEDGFISDENFDFDAGLKVAGDFVGNEKQQYAEMIAAVLNAHTLTPNV